AAGLTNPTHFKAWLSATGVTAPSRFTSNGPWVRLDGLSVASSLADLTDGQLASTLNLTETGTYLANALAWTDTYQIGVELGASLDFMTSDPSLGGRELKFTDVVLFRVHGLVAIGHRLELFGGADLLAKQPSYTDELVWQGGLAGARYRISDAFSAYA